MSSINLPRRNPVGVVVALRRSLVAASLVLALGLTWRRPTAGTAGTGIDGTALPPRAGAEAARVAEAVDGDTLLLADGRRVRILGLDAPETLHPGMAGPQPLGPEAAARLKALVEGRTVGLERDHSESDHYGRLLRHVWSGDDLVAARLLSEGLAWPLSIPPDRGHQAELAAAVTRARAARRGLWGLTRPTALAVFGHPWAPTAPRDAKDRP